MMMMEAPAEADHRHANAYSSASIVFVHDGENSNSPPPPPEEAPEDYADDDTSVSELRNNNNKPKHEEETAVIAKENQHVRLSRLLVFVVLVVSALAVSLVVYDYLKQAEYDQFVAQYRSDATKLLDALGTGLDHTLGSTDAFVAKMVAYSRYSNTTFPFVTMPDFYPQAAKLLLLSKSFRVSVSNLISPNQRVEWQEYADANRDWLNHSIDQQAQDPDFHGAIVRDYRTIYEIHDWMGLPLGPEPPWCFQNSGKDNDGSRQQQHCYHSVTWQHAPVIPETRPGSSPYNLDLYGIPVMTEGMLHAYETRKAVILGFGGVWDPNTDDPVMQEMIRIETDSVKRYIPATEDPGVPTTIISYPIIAELDTLRIDIGEDDVASNHTMPPVQALFSIYLRWVELLRGMLAEQSVGLVIVFHQAECGNSFTYQLNGPDAELLGLGDMHDTNYDLMGISANLADLVGANPASSGYAGLPLAHDFCAKTINVYPSVTMESGFHTSRPALMAIALALSFVFTSFVFVLYDVLVARRQRVLLSRAIASGTIVSSLFPEAVKKQLYEKQQQEQELQANQLKFLAPTSSVLSLSRNNGGGASEGSDSHQPGEKSAPFGKPIADHYSASSVIMADLAGFTQWSDSRTPSDVFELLEAVYYAFDDLALRRDVFKIETVGDCYVAVTGVPHPQKDHAVRMVRFGADCIHTLKRVVTTLADHLGEGTELLGLRVGISSGDITAGVIRSDRARFQLFGDTINTASRMETSGAPGKIHVSEATAAELKAMGKGHWLLPRDGRLELKGKGKMSTYWATVTGGPLGESSHTISERRSQLSLLSTVPSNGDGTEDTNHVESVATNEIRDLEKRLHDRL